jgi:hypothetical protein
VVPLEYLRVRSHSEQWHLLFLFFAVSLQLHLQILIIYHSASTSSSELVPLAEVTERIWSMSPDEAVTRDLVMEGEGGMTLLVAVMTDIGCLQFFSSRSQNT